MKVEIRDAKMLGALRPLEVAAYLRANGWVQRPSKALASVWILEQSGELFESIVPLDQSLSDYPLRMGELLQTIAVAERRSQTDVFSDLMTTFADVVRIRIIDPELNDGTLPIEVHAQIAHKARDLLLAAACSTLERRPIWYTRKPTQAVDQIRRLRIGQSERGSYILTVISPVGPTLLEAALPTVDPPFERKVTQMLASSLVALEQAAAQAAQAQSFQSFDTAVSQGVSANLCDAVAGLCGEDERNRQLEFLFAWSPARPVEKHIPSRIRFASDRIPVIREASRVLKERTPCEEFEVEGAVVKLDRDHNQSLGRVTVIAPVEGKQYRIALELNDSDYARAIQAHSEQQPFRCVGTLVRQGRGYLLRNPRDVTIDTD